MNFKKCFLVFMLVLSMTVSSACNGPVIPEDTAAPDQMVEDPASDVGEEEQTPEPEKEESGSEAPQQQEEPFTEEEAKALGKKIGVQTFGERAEDYGFRSCVADEKGYVVTYAKGFEVAGLDFLYQIVTTLNAEGEVLDCTHTHEIVNELPLPDEPEMVVENVTHEQLLEFVKREYLDHEQTKVYEDSVEISNIKRYEFETGYKLQLKVDYRFETSDGGGLSTTGMYDYYVQ